MSGVGGGSKHHGAGRVDLVTLDSGMGRLNLPRNFSFTQYAFTGGPGTFPVVCTATVTGARTFPGPDTTMYAFDTTGRLTLVTDPLGRDVAAITWTAGHDPFQVTNVFGGVTTRQYDANGNVTSLQPPTGGAWQFLYDGTNNLTRITDPLGHATNLEYADPLNPTRPTLINGPGVSDLTLEWGGNVDYDLGQLNKTVGPNFVQQSFTYTGQRPGDGGGGEGAGECSFNGDVGRGRLAESLHGIGMVSAGQSGPVQDHGPLKDCAGNPYASGVSGRHCEINDDPCRKGAPGGPGGVQPSFIDCGGPPDPNEHITAPGCFTDLCRTEFDADGNAERVCGYAQCWTTFGPPPCDAAYNGNNQLLRFSEPMFAGWVCYENLFDAIGRQVSKQVTTNETLSVQFLPHFEVHVAHAISWTYDDALGQVSRTYDRADPPTNQQQLPVTTETQTDLAGRVSMIAQTYAESAQITTYAYNDSTVLPAVVETRPDGMKTEYYVDAAGNVRKIVHLDSGSNQILGYVYTRDGKQRVTQIDEYVGTQQTATTTYAYGDGHLTAADLDADSAQAVEPGKVYYSWFAGLSPASMQPGDPNRLVKEERTGTDAYRHEYWYDAGGNRLAVRKSAWDVTLDPPVFVPVEMTRYNYAHQANADEFDPRLAPNGNLRLGEPDPAAVDQPESRNMYGLDMLGQDKLLSYTRYLLDGEGGFADNHARYAFYEYRTNAGMMSRKMEYDEETRLQVNTEFTYRKRRLVSVAARHYTWPAPPAEAPPQCEIDLNAWGFVEAYAYNVFGERVGVMHCTMPVWGGVFPDMAHTCKRQISIYDYADGRLLAERVSDNYPPGSGAERFISLYTWGPTGVVARRGVSFRNGHWNPQGGNPPGEFVSVQSDVMRDYTYMKDHMGNVVALADSLTGQARLQRFDAFGNVVGGYVTFQCGAPPPSVNVDHDNADVCCLPDPYPPHCVKNPPTCTDPPPPAPAAPVERMQTGQFNWRGGEGSATDWAARDLVDDQTDPCPQARYWAYTTPSTGLVYMNARYYDPAVGRFTQADPLPYGPELLWGQNNRWTYCANDPVNCSDPTGEWIQFALGLAAISALAFGLWAGYSLATDSGNLAGALLTLLGIGGSCALTGAKASKLLMGLLLAWEIELGFLGLGASLLGPILGIGLIALGLFAIGMAVGYAIGQLASGDSRNDRRTRYPISPWHTREILSFSNGPALAMSRRPTPFMFAQVSTRHQTIETG